MNGLISIFPNYINDYSTGMKAINQQDLYRVIDRIKYAIDKGLRVYVGGNGGSAAISNHLCCDFIKGARVKTVSISCNTPLITAIGNDLGYDKSLSYQLENLLDQGSQDTVILISSSGNSPNIVEAAKLARHRHAFVIGFTGFDGGTLSRLAHINLHVPINNYGVVEDCHQSLMHIISQYIAQERVD